VDGRVVILTAEDYTLHELSDVASRVWEFVAEPVSLDEIARRISGEYDVTPERAGRDLVGFIPALLDIGAVVVNPDESEIAETMYRDYA